MAEIVVCVNNNAFMTFPSHDEIVHKLLNAGAEKQGDHIHLKMPFQVLPPHLWAVQKILAGRQLIPRIDVKSHYDVYVIVRILPYFGVNEFLHCFGDWCVNRNWLLMERPEYLYMVYLISPELVDFARYFAHHGKVDFIRGTMEIDELRKNPTQWIEMLKFFKNYKFELCFTENNASIQNKVQKLDHARNKITELFLVNPYSDHLAGYFIYTPSALRDVWKCDGITPLKRPNPGDVMLCSAEEAERRFNEFTFGLMKIFTPLEQTAKNNETTMPRQSFIDNVVIAGGSISKILDAVQVKISRQSDVDMFIIGKNAAERCNTLKQLIMWFDELGKSCGRAYFAVRDSVITVYMKNVQRRFQIIASNHKSAADVLNRFDFYNIQWCLYKGRFYGTPEACQALRTRVTDLSSGSQAHYALRVIKSLYCGFDIAKSNEFNAKYGDISELIAPNNPQLARLIRDLHGFYYPMDMPDMTPNEEHLHIMNMIERDAHANMVCDTPLQVMQTATIGASLVDSYNSVEFTSFNDAIICPIHRIRQRSKLRSQQGVITVISDEMTVKNVIINKKSIDVIMGGFSRRFADFCNMLEATIYPRLLFHNVSRTIISDNQIKLEIPCGIIERQIQRGNTCLHTQRGSPLNIKEDLRSGDRVKMLFVIEYVNDNNQHYVNLIPRRFIKYCDDDLIDMIKETDGMPSVNIPAIMQSAGAGEIVYEEI